MGFVAAKISLALLTLTLDCRVIVSDIDDETILTLILLGLFFYVFSLIQTLEITQLNPLNL